MLELRLACVDRFLSVKNVVRVRTPQTSVASMKVPSARFFSALFRTREERGPAGAGVGGVAAILALAWMKSPREDSFLPTRYTLLTRTRVQMAHQIKPTCPCQGGRPT
jgi:hypothetical protein